VRLIIILSCLTLALAACGGSGPGGGEQTAVAAFYPLAWAAERVAPPGLRVVNLTPAGAEPHDVELTPKDVVRLQRADYVIYIGSGFQPSVEDALDGARGTRIDALEGLALRPGEEGQPAADPHVWLDPVRFAQIVRRIGRTFGREAAAARVAGELRTLDGDYRRGLARCERRTLVTSHAAFGYLAERYGLRQIPIAGLSPEAEPTPRRLADVVHRVRETHATTVFFETLVSPRIARTVARETGARTAVLDPLEGLTKNELARGESYLTVMRDNLAALRNALGCS
jgi:zinc transport system substrate-binding protein